MVHDTLILDGGSDTCTIGEKAWIIEYISKKTMNTQGFHKDLTIQSIPIGGAITACDLPNETTALLQVNEASLLGEDANSLLSIAQLRANQVFVFEIPRKYGGFPILKQKIVFFP